MIIEIVKENELEAVHEMIAKTVRTSFPKYYPKGSIEYVIESLSVEALRQRANVSHFYVVKEFDKIIGCGAITGYFGSETESILLSIFVDPDFQGKGYGRKIIETLEADEFGLMAKRIEIPASMVAIPFYKKMGYEHKNGELNYDDGHFALEKYRK